MRCGRPTGTPLHECTAVAQITIFDSSLKIFLSFREEEKPKKKPNLFWSSSSQILCRVFLTVRNVSVLSCHLPHFSFWKKIDNRFLSLSIGPACQSGNLIAEGNLFFPFPLPSCCWIPLSFSLTTHTYFSPFFLEWVWILRGRNRETIVTALHAWKRWISSRKLHGPRVMTTDRWNGNQRATDASIFVFITLGNNHRLWLQQTTSCSSSCWRSSYFGGSSSNCRRRKSSCDSEAN